MAWIRDKESWFKDRGVMETFFALLSQVHRVSVPNWNLTIKNNICCQNWTVNKTEACRQFPYDSVVFSARQKKLTSLNITQTCWLLLKNKIIINNNVFRKLKRLLFFLFLAYLFYNKISTLLCTVSKKSNILDSIIKNIYH